MDDLIEFERYMAHLNEGLGHADRHAGLRGYCTGLMSPLSRKSVEPMAAHVDPLKVRSRHQSLHHFVADARGAARRVAQQWRGMRQVAVGPVNRDAARGLAARGEAVLQASQVLVAMLENAAGTAQARLINLAGRQRMLSQRLAKLYMLRAYGVDTASIRDDLDSASREFEAALASLRAAPENTPAIAVELEAVALQWEWFHSAIALQGAESYALVVADASESILNSMELITAKYAALARR